MVLYLRKSNTKIRVADPNRTPNTHRGSEGGVGRAASANIITRTAHSEALIVRGTGYDGGRGGTHRGEQPILLARVRPGHHVRQLTYSAFGLIGTILREIEWKTPIFSWRVIPKSANAS